MSSKLLDIIFTKEITNMAKDLGELTEIAKQHERDIHTIVTEIEGMRFKMYDPTIELKQQQLESNLEHIITKLDKLACDVDGLTASDAKQEKILYIGVGILIATQFIGSNSGALTLIGKVFGGSSG